jgi:hypothetical protein
VLATGAAGQSSSFVAGLHAALLAAGLALLASAGASAVLLHIRATRAADPAAVAR